MRRRSLSERALEICEWFAERKCSWFECCLDETEREIEYEKALHYICLCARLQARVEAHNA